MLESAVVSQIAVTDLTHVADFIQSRTYRAFETYFAITLIYLAMALAVATCPCRPPTVCRAATDDHFIAVRYRPFPAARCALDALLSAIAFVGGGCATVAFSCCAMRGHPGRLVCLLYVDLFQGTPLLLQLFLVFFGLPLFGIEVSPLLAAGLALTLYAGAFLAEIWRGCVDAVPRGQWEASASLGLNF